MSLLWSGLREAVREDGRRGGPKALSWRGGRIKVVDI